MISSTLRKGLLIIGSLLLSAWVFSALIFKGRGTDINKSPNVETKPSQTKVLVVASQVIEDESAKVRGDSQLELDLTPPDGTTTSTFAVQATGDGTKQFSIAALDQGQICWVNFSFNTIVQLNGSVDAQSLALEFTLTETFEDKPSATSDCTILPPIDGALFFVPFTEGPYELSPANPVVKLSSEPNSWTEVSLVVDE